MTHVPCPVCGEPPIDLELQVGCCWCGEPVRERAFHRMPTGLPWLATHQEWAQRHGHVVVCEPCHASDASAHLRAWLRDSLAS